MKRHAHVIQFKKDRVEEYKTLHRNVWPDVLARIRESNIRDYSIAIEEDSV